MPYFARMASSTISYNRDKLRAAILHVVNSCDPAKLGAVKLHKVLYYSDMLYFLATGDAITGAAYRKRPFGPTCDSALSVVDELSRTGEIEVRQVDYYGYQKKEFVPKHALDTNRLSESEKSVISEMIEFVCNSNSAKTISDFSHDMVWDMVEFGDTIPYHNAIHLIPNVPSQEALDWAAVEVEKIADIGLGAATKSPVAGSRESAIRARMAELSRR